MVKLNKPDTKTLFIDASAEFHAAPKQNKLEADHRAKILTALANRQSIKHFAELVDKDAIAENDYSLSVQPHIPHEVMPEEFDPEELEARGSRKPAEDTREMGEVG